MRRIHMLFAATAVLLCASISGAQSLGDIARQQRHGKHPSNKVYTNEDLPKEGTVNVVGAEAPPASDVASPTPNAEVGQAKNSNTAEAKTDAAPGTDKAYKEKVKNDLAATVTAAKKDVAQLERDLDILNREFRIRAATFYADAGNSLRDPKKWADERKAHDDQVAEKQKALDAAKQKLADVEDQARRSGIAVE